LTGCDAPGNAHAMASEADMAALSFEDALKQLEGIVQQLERGDVPLDESITLYERGDQLRALCQTRLEAAQARIELITRDPAADTVTTKTFPGS
jgi:exodeoxyribonuclease VII small subunit